MLETQDNRRRFVVSVFLSFIFTALLLVCGYALSWYLPAIVITVALLSVAFIRFIEYVGAWIDNGK